jgi:ketosteroid isomerase-like protein
MARSQRQRHSLVMSLRVALVAGLAIACSRTTSRRASLDAATTAFHQALRTNDTVSFFSYLADDVTMMPPAEPPVRGKEAMHAWMAAFLSQFRTTGLTLGDREVLLGDGWATELGSYEWRLTPVAGGAEVVDRGHYMQVWKRLPDGQWRFAREIWNSSVLPPAGTS